MRKFIAIALSLFITRAALAGGIHNGPNRAVIAQNPYVAPVGGCASPGTLVAFRSSSNSTAATTTNKTVTAPAGLTNGDGIWAHCHIENDTEFVTPPSGFTQLASSTNTSTTPDNKSFVFYKLASGEPGSYQFNFGPSFSQCLVAAYSNVNSGCGPAISSTSVNTFSAATNWTVGAINTPDINTMLIISQGNLEGNNNNPALTNERVDTSQISLEDVVQAAAGTTGVKNGGTSASSSGNIIFGGFYD